MAVMMRNRLGTEEREASQIQLDVLPELLNERMDKRIKASDMDVEWLRRCEQRQTVRPFPHNVAVDSVGAGIEDMVAYCPFGWSDPEFPSGLFLGEWVAACFTDEDVQVKMYYAIREYLSENEFDAFDSVVTCDKQANLLLLVAHAYFFEHENDRWANGGR